ncbi:hypothetical protein CF326_g540 [Tilletia indica]|nr:hypothetical protein CF326_g540 [Tilletia indica]
MKYLDYPQFAELSRALTFTSSECTVFTRIEAYSCKPVAQEKRLYKHIQRIYAPEVAARKYGYALESHDEDDDDHSHDEHHHHHRSTASPRIGFSINPSSSSIPPHLADSPFGNLTQSSTARKLLFTVIATLNAAFPDHDFADIPVSTFRREPSPAYVVHSLSSTLQSLRRNAAGNNPDAPAAAAAATSPTNPGTSAARSSTAFLSAAPRTFAGLPTSFDSSPTPFNATGSSSSSTGPSRGGGIGSPSIAATLSPPGHLAQLSLSERAPPSTSFSASSAALASSTVPPAIDLPPPVSNAQSSTYPSHPRATHDPTDQRHAFSRSPISPRLAGTTSPRMGSASASAAISYPSPSHLPAAINAATHPALASILDDIMCVEECEVYSFHPDIEYDPHASADDDEERLLGAVGDGAGGGLGLFEEEVADDGGIDIGPANEGGGSDNSAYGRTARRWGPKGANAEGVYAYEHDDLEDIAEQFGEDEVEDDGDPMRPEQMARSLRAKERVTEAGRRAVNDDDDEEMGEADDALLFDEDVYGQGLSGTQTPRAPDHTQMRPDLSSDVSSSTLFSSSSSSSANLDGDTSMGDSESLGRSVGQHSSPSKARVLGPADRSQQGAWGRPVSNATKDRDRDEDDEDDEDEFLSDADLYSDTSDRSAVVAAEKEDEDDAAGLLWATYAFFYNKRLKRVLFVSVWARTNAGVEAHAAAAAAAARARERVLRMSTSPRGGPSSSSIGFGNSTSGQNISSSWPGPGGGKASSWSGMSPAQRAISASTQTSSGGAGGGGFAAKASRSSGTSPTNKKGGDPSKAAAAASSYSSSSSSSSSRKSSGRKESSLSKKTRREASAVGAVRGVAAAAAATVGRRRRSSLGQSVITSMEAVEREGSTSRGTTPIATPIATSSTGATTIAAASAGTATTSLTVPGGGGEQSVAVSSLPAPLVVDALRGVPTSSSRNGTPPPPSARSPFPHASPRKPGDVPGAAAAVASSTTTAPVNVPVPRSQVGVGGTATTGEDTSFSIPSSWQSNTSSSPIPISSAMSGSNSNNSGGGGGGGRSFYGSMPSLDGAVLSARAGGGTPGTSGQVPVQRQFPKRVHPDQEGDSKRPRVDAE